MQVNVGVYWLETSLILRKLIRFQLKTYAFHQKLVFQRPICKLEAGRLVGNFLNIFLNFLMSFMNLAFFSF